MSKYAIIKLSGKQYRVEAGDEFIVDKLDIDEGEKLKCDVLLIKDEDKLLVGTPQLDKNVVEIEVTTQQKGKKLRVSKFKAKSRYRRVFGHRQHQSVVKVLSIK